MRLFGILLFVLMLLQQQKINVFGIKENQFCNIVEKECKGSMARNRYEIICEYAKCSQPFIYRCGSHKCVVGQKECQEYLKMNRYSNSVTFKTNVKLMSQKAIDTIASFDEEFFRFKKKIKNCTQSVYNWESIDICLVERNCFQKAEIPGNFNFISKIFSTSKYILKRVNCPCKCKRINA